ncbi:hypothetical protein FCL47_21080 [Desulfopila sp. IMCC35006]|uniref:hypothetical protein n=1 Tax=Desulfopila sp. IMCC35006 TaxID=2569542 RepID=UPI0010AD1A6E|nr:hypothetical protein [Desulfopila sp. IMCC35006]TKB23829.1 hypothetical protein FCL47_21080 [Desulfopila sp. IMCC35006]
MKNVILPILLVLQFLCGGSVLYAQDLETHRAFKVTSYDLGAIENFQSNGSAVSRNFQPLLITSTVADILNNEHERTVIGGGMSTGASNVSSIALSTQIDATNNISLQGAFGVTRNLWTPELMGDLNGSSWEANLGVIYRFLNHFSYELHFGYMDTGNVFRDRSSYSNVESIIMISNKITLSF